MQSPPSSRSRFSSPWAYVWWYQCSRTPPLTDDSLLGTLLPTVQCTAILPQRALDLWWMDTITPLGSEWCLPESGRRRFSGSYHIHCRGMCGQVESVLFQTGTWSRDGVQSVCGLGLWCSRTRTWSPLVWTLMRVCASGDAHPLLCCYGDCSRHHRLGN